MINICEVFLFHLFYLMIGVPIWRPIEANFKLIQNIFCIVGVVFYRVNSAIWEIGKAIRKVINCLEQNKIVRRPFVIYLKPRNSHLFICSFCIWYDFCLSSTIIRRPDKENCRLLQNMLRYQNLAVPCYYKLEEWCEIFPQITNYLIKWYFTVASCPKQKKFKSFCLWFLYLVKFFVLVWLQLEDQIKKL